MAVRIENWNKLIDITLGTGTEALQILSPRNGRKPDITISGKFDTKTQANTVEIRIVGLYTTKIQDFNTVRISAGYAQNMNQTLVGSITNIYQESPGPDGITVISCTTAEIDSWLNKQIVMDLAPGFGMRDAVAAIAKALNFNSFEPRDNPISEAGIQLNTTAHDALAQMKNYFPDYNFRVSNNTVIADKQEAKDAVNEFNIDFLCAPPQYSGPSVTITAPWNPAIKVGDFVTFSTKYYQAVQITQGATFIKDKYKVSSIAFQFGTVSQDNRMTIIGVANEQ